MATIPMGNFGNRMAEPARAARVPMGNPLAQQAERLATTAQGITLDQIAADRQEQEAQKRADAALALAKTQNALHDAHNDIAGRLSAGSLSPDDAQAEWAKLSSKARTDGLTGLDEVSRTHAMAHLEQVGGSLTRSLGAVVTKRKQQDTAATIDAFGEQVQREATRTGPAWAVKKFGEMVDFTGEAAGLDPEKRAKLKQSFAERAHASYYQTAATGMLTKGDADGLGKLVEKLNGPDGEALDPQKRAVLTHQVFGWQQSILAARDREAAAAATEQRRREDQAGQAFDRAWKVYEGGGFLSPETIADLSEKAAGTAVEPQVTALLSSQREVAGFAGRAAPERAALLERMRAARATPGVGVSPQGDEVIRRLDNMNDGIQRQIDENPWQAAQRAGRIQDAPVFNAADPTAAVQVIQQRMQMIGTVEEWAGKRVSPLQPPEVEQIGKMVRSLPIEQAAGLLAGIGQAVGNGERVAALSKQLHDKDGSLGLAMSYASAQTTQGRYVAELVLRGDQALRDKTVQVDKAAETGWRSTIAKAVRGAYASREIEDRVIDAAFLITSAKYAQDGSNDLDNAVRLATGGGIMERNGQKFPLPWGMKPDEFDRKVSAIKPGDLSEQAPSGRVLVGGQSMSLDDFTASLGTATLVHAGQGLYNVKAGQRIVTNEQGRRIVLKVVP